MVIRRASAHASMLRYATRSWITEKEREYHARKTTEKRLV